MCLARSSWACSKRLLKRLRVATSPPDPLLIYRPIVDGRGSVLLFSSPTYIYVIPPSHRAWGVAN